MLDTSAMVQVDTGFACALSCICKPMLGNLTELDWMQDTIALAMPAMTAWMDRELRGQSSNAIAQVIQAERVLR